MSTRKKSWATNSSDSYTPSSYGTDDDESEDERRKRSENTRIFPLNKITTRSASKISKNEPQMAQSNNDSGISMSAEAKERKRKRWPSSIATLSTPPVAAAQNLQFRFSNNEEQENSPSSTISSEPLSPREPPSALLDNSTPIRRSPRKGWIKCSYCNALRFKSADRFRDHLRERHRYRCDLCYFIFGDGMEAFLHWKTAHFCEKYWNEQSEEAKADKNGIPVLHFATFDKLCQNFAALNVDDGIASVMREVPSYFEKKKSKILERTNSLSHIYGGKSLSAEHVNLVFQWKKRWMDENDEGNVSGLLNRQSLGISDLAGDLPDLQNSSGVSSAAQNDEWMSEVVVEPIFENWKSLELNDLDAYFE